MESNRPGEPDMTGRIIERQMLLRNARCRSEEQGISEGLDTHYSFVTISRDIGSLGDEIARLLAVRLGWHVFDKEIVNHISANSHVRETLVQQLDERIRTRVQDGMLRLFSMAESSSFGCEEYHEALIKTLTYLAAVGRAILVGRGANFALRQERSGLHIRLIASPLVRIQRLGEGWNLPHDQASKRMMDKDSERRAFIRHHFNQDLDDFRAYDLVFNTDRLSAEQVTAAILRVMVHEEDALQLMQRLSLTPSASAGEPKHP
jgi:cytidylate kinase